MGWDLPLNAIHGIIPRDGSFIQIDVDLFHFEVFFDSMTQHVAILEAINEGDIELAESLLRKHLLLAKKSS